MHFSRTSKGWYGVGLESWVPSIFWCNMRYMEILETLEFSRRDRLLAENGTFCIRNDDFRQGGKTPPGPPLETLGFLLKRRIFDFCGYTRINATKLVFYEKRVATEK